MSHVVRSFCGPPVATASLLGALGFYTYRSITWYRQNRHTFNVRYCYLRRNVKLNMKLVVHTVFTDFTNEALATESGQCPYLPENTSHLRYKDQFVVRTERNTLRH